MRYSMTNLACVARTPVKLVSWGHMAEISRLAGSGRRDRHFFKSDQEAAYRRRPMNLGRASLSSIALHRPATNVWCGFFSRALMFGAVASVLRYSHFSRWLYGIPPPICSGAQSSVILMIFAPYFQLVWRQRPSAPAPAFAPACASPSS